MSDIIEVHDIAKMFDVRRDVIRKWRMRYDDFPKRVHGTEHYPFYSRDEMTRWYLKQWPERAATWEGTLHRYYISSGSDARELTSIEFGPVLEARGYLRAVRELQYRDWRTWHTTEGFVAERGTEIHIWFLDVTNGEPEEWFVYQGRIKGGNK